MSEPKGHTLSAIISMGWVELKAICHEQDGRAVCRVECVHQECREEGWSLDDHVMPEEDFGEDSYHPLRPINHCNAVEWFNDGDMAERFEGKNTARIVDGMKIRVWWDGDNYVWEPQ